MFNQYLNTFFAAVTLPAAAQPGDPAGLVFFGVLITAVGLASLIYPRIFWHLRVGRKIPSVKPVNMYLLILRIGGLLTIFLGIFLIYMSRFI